MHIQQLHLPEHRGLASRIRELATDASRADHIDPLSEQFLRGLDDARLGHRHLLALDGDAVLGVAACDADADAPSCEMVVAPEARRQGVATALLAELGDADVWAHGNLPAARALADREGRVPTRRLLVMSIAGQALDAAARYEERPDVTALDLPDSVRRWGRELVEQAWLEANNDAFSWHPEQGGWDRARLTLAMEAGWFDERDVLFLWDEKKPALAGFHWTKWHTEAEPAFGEVYVVGLAADYRGRGLGDPLLRLGLEHLAAKGADRVILYVEADNAPAVRVYEKLGFATAEEHAVYSLP